MAELFDRFEVNRVPRWPLMSRLVALSVVLHGLFFVSIVYVPALRSLIRVAGSLSGIEFVSEDYDRTLLGQRATVVKLEPYEKLYYPADYFGPPPEAIPPADPMLMAQTAPPPPPVVIRQPRVRRPRAEVIATPEPTPTPQEIAQAEPTPTPADEAERKAAETKIDEAALKYGVKRPTVNPKPFEDFAQKGKEMYEQGRLKLDSSVDVTATAERNGDGTFKPESVKIKWVSASDPATEELAQLLITAFSQSRALAVLDGVTDVKMALKVDEQNISVRIANEFASEAEAGKAADGYAGLLFLTRLAKDGTDEGELYKNLKVGREGKDFILTFEMPKDAAGKMIAKMLERKAAKEKEKEAAGGAPANGKS
ncbi:MAG TPA: hypothetical protein VG148_17580 [Pyrinomonadaceae bacterium]|nr:hypothetical protein [Pyrinomonadaceae bacterium]